MNKPYFILLLIIITITSCETKELRITKVGADTFNSNAFRPNHTDTIWESKTKQQLIIRKTGRESLTPFLIDGNNYYVINLLPEDMDWAIEGDSIVVFFKPGYEHWSRYTGEYNGIWSELNINYSRRIYPYQAPESISSLPAKYGIYKLDTLNNSFVAVENTDHEGVYYFSKYWNGIHEMIMIEELLKRKNR